MNNIPDSIEIFLSENVLKNGMGVGIPGTTKTGLLIAAALGFVGGDAAAELEVLKDIIPSHLIAADNCIAQNKEVSVWFFLEGYHNVRAINYKNF